jgi:hypothetical protein
LCTIFIAPLQPAAFIVFAHADLLRDLLAPPQYHICGLPALRIGIAPNGNIRSGKALPHLNVMLWDLRYKDRVTRAVSIDAVAEWAKRIAATRLWQFHLAGTKSEHHAQRHREHDCQDKTRKIQA